MNFKKILEHGRIGKMEVKHRVIMAPFCTHLASRDGEVTPRMVRYYRERAKGGTGLIIVEYSYIDTKASKSSWCQLGVYDDACIVGLATLAEAIQDYGAKAALQINHCGVRKYIGIPPMVSPSGVAYETSYGRVIPTELTIEEIIEIVKAFGESARRVKQAGFDMVEVHGAHGYLITNFLSRLTNKRTDGYGGSLQNRMRFALEVVENIREKVGNDFPLGVRISAVEYMENGITLNESIEFSKTLEKAGVDAIHVSAGNDVTSDRESEPMYYPVAAKVPCAEAIKKAVSIPVIASGSITSPEIAEDILEKGKADFVSLARPLAADPYFVRKVEEGRPEDIRPCIRCCDCNGRATLWKSIGCSVNATVGKEEEYKIEPVPTPKRVCVVGGGPAGMEAARVAALRGHKVILYEKRKTLGGLLIEASTLKFKKDISKFREYLITQLKNLKVKNVNEEATAETIEKEGFDEIILATGSYPAVPSVRGSDKSCVVTPIDIIHGKKIGKDIILVGGGVINCEVALYLAEKGKNVRIITRQYNIARDVDPNTQKAIQHQLQKYDVKVHFGLILEEITDDGIIVTDRHGERTSFGGDTIVFGSMVSNSRLAQELKRRKIRFISIGDCVEPRRIYSAVHEGYMAARSI